MADPILEKELIILLRDAAITNENAKKIIEDGTYGQQKFLIRQTKTRLTDHIKSFDKFRPAKGKQDVYEYADKLLPVITETRYNSLELNEFCAENEKVVQISSPTVRTGQISRTYDIQVPIFNGEHDEYPRFREAFTVAIDETSMSNKQKMIFFRDHLAPGVRNRIEAIPVSDENYAIVLKIIDDFYTDERRILQTLYMKLTALPTATNTTASLRETYDKVETILRALERHKIDLENDFIVNLVEDKYPQEILYNVSEKGVPTTKLLREHVAQRLYVQERIDGRKSTITVKEEKPVIPIASLVAPNIEQPKVENKVSTEVKVSPAEQKKQQPKVCQFCGDEKHLPEDCTKFKTSKERRTALRERACILCLRKNHSRPYCRAKVEPCKYCEKQTAHHSAFCPSKFGYIWPNAEPTKEISEVKVVGIFSTDTDTYLVAVARVFDPITSSSRYCRIFLDIGAGRTYILEEVANQLGLRKFQRNRLGVGRFNSAEIGYVDTHTVYFCIEGVDKVLAAETIPIISDAVPSINYEEVKRRFPELQRFDFAHTDQGKIDILIGGDYYFNFFTPDPPRQILPDIFIVHTIFGLMLSGKIDRRQRPPVAMMLAASNSAILQQLWDLETIGIRDPGTKDAAGEELAVQQFTENLIYEVDRYSVTLPWKQVPPQLPTNFATARGRLISLLRQHAAHQEYLTACDEIFMKQLDEGIIERAPNTITSTSHYLPYHFVFTPEKSTPLRVVYDASSKASKNVNSLNDCLLKGINTIPHVPTILIRFRLKPTAIIADIKHAFHNVAIQPQDRDYLRFLWTTDRTDTKCMKQITFRFARVPFGVISSGFLLGATISYHLANSTNPLAKEIQKNLYIDDYVASVDSVTEAKNMVDNAIALFREAGMLLHKWCSNDPTLQHVIEQGTADQKQVTKVLGVHWDTSTDYFTFPVPDEFDFKAPITKRRVLKSIAQLYDPLSLMAPVLIVARIFMQQLHKEKYTWNAVLSDQLIKEWKIIHENLIQIQEMALTRYLHGYGKNPQFHVFVDASAKAYAAVVYVRYICINTGAVCVRIIMAKSRVAPIEPITIPRMELLAAVIGTRLLTFVREAFGLTDDDAIIWLDSTCVLDWVSTRFRLPTFVSNRIEEIKRCPRVEFRHVSGKLNPADLPSRGISTRELMSSDHWWLGPDFLREPASNWPPTYVPAVVVPIPIEIPRIVQLVTTQKVATPFGIEEGNFTRLPPLIRITAICVHFIRRLQKNTMKSFPRKAAPTEIAKALWLQYAQQSHFADVFHELESRTKHTGIIRDLRLYIGEDGLLRTRGRFFNAVNLPNHYRELILLPKPTECYYSKLVILNVHSANLHVGTNHTLNTLRKQYWILAGRKQVFAVIRKCPACSRDRAAPYQQPEESDIPEIRFKIDSPPFSCIGMDVAGHFIIDAKKRWIMLTTCLVSRAISLEVMEDMTTKSFSTAYRRVVARHVSPQFLLSDHAPQFVLLNGYLHKARTQPFQWEFTTDYSPWKGATYERLVALVKSTLYRSLREARIGDDNEFRTLVLEIEAVLNERPITSITEENDIKPLTPNDFLKVRNEELNIESIQLPHQITEPARKVHEMWRAHEEILKQMKQLWLTEYLGFLRERADTQDFRKRTNTYIPKIGDIVTIADPHQKRAKWILAVVHQLQISSDNKIRSCVVRLPSGTKVIRSIQDLYFLEMNELDQQD